MEYKKEVLNLNMVHDPALLYHACDFYSIIQV